VYGQVELSHCYRYHASGALAEAVITSAADETIVAFDEAGMRRVERSC